MTCELWGLGSENLLGLERPMSQLKAIIKKNRFDVASNVQFCNAKLSVYSGSQEGIFWFNFAFKSKPFRAWILHTSHKSIKTIWSDCATNSSVTGSRIIRKRSFQKINWCWCLVGGQWNMSWHILNVFQQCSARNSNVCTSYACADCPKETEGQPQRPGWVWSESI